ncbi:MAG: acyl transferase [Bacteroidetes bacterium]|nr:acyl transferase [Bacteroidota bacterium]
MSTYPCFSIADESSFQEVALQVFREQSKHVKVYREYLEAIQVDPLTVGRWEDIPYLPIEFFRTREVIKEGLNAEVIFQSSGSTSTQSSKHFISDTAWYIESFMRGFKMHYGNIDKYALLALLPSYLQKGDSSLVYMTDHLIQASKNAFSGFYLDDYASLAKALSTLKVHRHKTILLGVSYALLDLSEKFPMQFPELIILETGGMKGRRKELVKEELHAILKSGFGVEKIHSEYGMTELLSQAYSRGDGIFHCPPWMKVRIREMNDPFHFVDHQKTGGVCVTDLANQNSCAFIATQDLGRLYPNGSFEILGRFDDSEARGCNLLVDF